MHSCHLTIKLGHQRRNTILISSSELTASSSTTFSEGWFTFLLLVSCSCFCNPGLVSTLVPHDADLHVRLFTLISLTDREVKTHCKQTWGIFSLTCWLSWTLISVDWWNHCSRNLIPYYLINAEENQSPMLANIIFFIKQVLLSFNYYNYKWKGGNRFVPVTWERNLIPWDWFLVVTLSAVLQSKNRIKKKTI